MTRNDIITIPDPRLRTPSEPVAKITAQVKTLAADMVAALTDWEDSRQHEFAAALAAVQVGQLQRVVVVRKNFEDKADRRFDVLINPEVVKSWGEPVEDLEGCLSVPSIYAHIARPPKVKVRALSLEGKTINITADGFLGRVLQHEIDHTNGIITLDRAKDPSKLFHLDNSGNFVPYQPSL